MPLLLLLLLAPACGLTEEYEREPTLAVAELVEPSLLGGPHFRLQPHARIAGLQAHFIIETDWGALDATGVELLARRVEEMPLVEALHSETIMAALGEAGVGTLRVPLQTLQSISSSPLESAARLPSGVFRLFGTRLRSYGDRARRIGNRVDHAVSNDGSPAGRGHRSAAADEPWWDAPVDEFDRLLRSEAGHGRARRDIANAVGIDPSTSNPLLRERLDTLAWALASGRLATDRLISLLSASVSDAFAAVATAERLTAIATPEELRRTLEARLQGLTSDATLSYRLAWRSAYPPARLQRLLDRLSDLGPANASEALLDTAALARTEVESMFVINALELLLHNGDVEVAGGTLVPVGQLVGYRARDGEFLLPLAVDRLSWTPEVQRWFDHILISGNDRRTVLLAGAISADAERALTRRGWSIRSHVRWPGSPPYRSPGSGA
jgi:hypothetical protein